MAAKFKGRAKEIEITCLPCGECTGGLIPGVEEAYWKKEVPISLVIRLFIIN